MYTKHFNDTLIMRTNDVTHFDEAIRELVNLTGSWDEFNEGLPKSEDCSEILRYLVSILPPIPKAKRDYLRKVILENGSCVGERELNCMNEMMAKALFCGFDWETKVEKIQDYCFDKTWLPVFYEDRIGVVIQDRIQDKIELFCNFNFNQFVNALSNSNQPINDYALSFEKGVFYQMVKPGYLETSVYGAFENLDQAFADAFNNHGYSLVTD